MDAAACMVADIGRQSVRFAIGGGASGHELRDIRRYQIADHSTFTSALIAYLTEIGVNGVGLPSALAVAGAARGDLINLTGSRWYISLSGLESSLGVRPVALNECAAVAHAMKILKSGDFVQIGSNAPRPVLSGGNYLVLNIGTGLGVAALVTTDAGRLAPVQSEAGHMSFAPRSAEEERFVAHMRKTGSVSAEALLSANGLVCAYAALAGEGTSPVTPEYVTASIDRDRVAKEVAKLFIGYLGAFIGDLVLAFGTWQGIFLTGPLPRALHHHLIDPRLRQRLEAKDAFRRQLNEVPIALVNRSDLELLGAAAFLREHRGQ